MKEKKVYLTIAYMFIVLAMTFLVVNTEVLAIESNAENSRVNENVDTEKTTFKSKVKYKNFPKSIESNQVIRPEVSIRLTKNGIDLGTSYEKIVSPRFDEAELTWNNLEKYTVENGIQKENVYEVKVNSNDINEELYKVELTSNEVVITLKTKIKDYDASVEFKDFEENEIKPNFIVELYDLSEPNKTLDEKYDKRVESGKEITVPLKWKNLPYNGNQNYGIRIKNPETLDKEKYTVVESESKIFVTKKKIINEENDKYVEIKDLVFKKRLIDIINELNREKSNHNSLLNRLLYGEKTIDSKISKEELAEIKNLGRIKDYNNKGISFDFKEIKNLEGIENLVNLEEINISGVDKKQILEISKLKTIKKMQISITDDFEPEYLNGFINLENLKIVFEKNNELKDLSFLKYMKNLNKLEISGKEVEIKNLDDIKDSSIKELYLDVKNIQNVTPIGENINLEKLTIKLQETEHLLQGGTDKEKEKAKLDSYIQAMVYYKLRKGVSRDEIIKYIKEFKASSNLSTPTEAEIFMNELNKGYSSYKIKDLKELLKLKNLKFLTLSGVNLENIDGISNLKNLEELDISYNFVSNISELLKLDKLENLAIYDLPIYDRRIEKELREKNVYIKHEGGISRKYNLVINPKKFILPDIYNEDGEKFDLLNGEKDRSIYAPMGFGPDYPSLDMVVDLYKDINNIIKKNKDGTYSYKYKPYEPITVETNNGGILSLYPINDDYNDQDLNKIDKRYVIDKSKIVKFKNQKLKKYILYVLKNIIPNSYSDRAISAKYIKEQDEMEVYEDELKFIEKVDLRNATFLGDEFEVGGDLSDLVMFSNLNALRIYNEVESLEFLKDLPNLRFLTLDYMKKGQHLPKFKENNKLHTLIISTEWQKFDKKQIEDIKIDILDNNLSNLKRLNVKFLDEISLIGLEDLRNLIGYSNLIDTSFVSDTYEAEELNINYNNNKISTEKELLLFDKNTDENVVIRKKFKPTSKKFRINILDKVNNKNIEINDPVLRRNEDGTYEMVSYTKKIQEVKFEIDGKKVILKIDTTGIPLTQEERQRKEELEEYRKDDLKNINNELEFGNVKNVSFVVDNENDFEMLKKFKNIETLNLYVNITDNSKLDWSIIKNLKNLKKLIIHDGFDIANIDGMESLEELITSEIKDYYNVNGERNFSQPSVNIKNTDKISTLKNLKVLNLPSANIKNIDFLKELTNLEELYLVDNNIESIYALKNLDKLRIVKLSANKIANIDGLKNKENLRVLELQENKITDISALEKSLKLYHLDIAINDVENVDVLRNFKKLNYIGLIDNPRLKRISGLKEALKENISPNIFLNVSGTSVEDEDLVETININDRVYKAFYKGNTITIKPKRNKFDINLTQNGNKIELSDAPLFRYSGLIKNEDGTYSIKDYKNSGVIRLNIGSLPSWIEKDYYEVYSNNVLKPYHYLYIDPSDIEDEVIPTPEEENKVEEKVEKKISEIHEKQELIIPQAKLPYAGMQDDTMLKVLLVLVSIYTIASFNLYKKGLEKKNNNK